MPSAESFQHYLLSRYSATFGYAPGAMVLNRFSGSFVALVTPIKNGKLDIPGLKKNLQFQLKNRTDGFVPCGTTGEAPTLSFEEWAEVIKTTVSVVKKAKPVIAGCGTNDTKKTLLMAQKAEELGSDGLLVVAPYYNRPTQEGLYRHYRTISEAVKLPIIVYNIPGRTGVNILPKTLQRLVKDCPNILGVKEASGNLDQISEVIRLCEERLSVLSGDDSLTLPILSIGGKGVISVVANILPRATHNLVDYFLKGLTKKAQELHKRLLPLIKALFIETNPIPIKTAMNLLGMPAGELRLPLCEPSKESFSVIKKALVDYGLKLWKR